MADGEDKARGGWSPSLRYPDPLVQSLDRRFDKYRLPLASVDRLWTGSRWGEGPVWFGDGRYLLWSDVPGDCVRRWDEETGMTSVFRKPSNNANGNTRDRQGRLITCEHLSRRVTRTEYDGSITVICDRFEGKRLNSPNDVVVKSDGSIWFTDPRFGILSNYEGEIAEPELPMNVYRVDGKTGAVTVVAGEINAPNGLAFSPDEKKLYIVESRSEPRRILSFDVNGDKIANGKILIDFWAARHAGWFPLRYGRQPVVRLGYDARTRRRACVYAARRADRPHFIARTLRQCLFRRRQTQPPVHGGRAFALRALRQCARCAGRLASKQQRCREVCRLPLPVGERVGVRAL